MEGIRPPLISVAFGCHLASLIRDHPDTPRRFVDLPNNMLLH